MATAQQKANSLREQRQRFNKTGRPTKGLIRAGGFAATEGQKDYTVQHGESLFSIAASVLGSGATQTQIAAYAQELAAANNGIQVLQSGAHIRLPSAVLTPESRPTKAFMEAANAQTVLGGFKVPSSVETALQRSMPPGAGSPPGAGASLPPGVGSPSMGLPPGAGTPAPVSYFPTRATQGLGAPVVNGQPTPSYDPQAIQSLRAGAIPSGTSSFTQIGQMAQELYPGSYPALPSPQASQSTSKPLAGAQVAGATSSRGGAGAALGAGSAEAVRLTSMAYEAFQNIADPNDTSTAAAAIAAMPTLITDLTRRAMGLTPYDMAQNGYVEAGGSWTPDPDLLNTIRSASKSSEDLKATIYDYNRAVWQGSSYTRAYGVNPYRPRRGGVGATGSSMFAPVVVDPYASFGGSLSGTWRIGI